MNNKYSSLLNHDYNNFTKKHITTVSNNYGIFRKDILETHLWVYELYAQIQNITGEHCILKGGACSQLYIPLDFQRCTADIDCATSLTTKELSEVLSSITYKFNLNHFSLSFHEYIPQFVKLKGRTIPMATFMFNFPFVFKQKKKHKPSMLKVDFLFVDTLKLHTQKIDYGETLGLKLNYSPLCIEPHALICDKLITLAVHSIGLDPHKIDGLYKNIYDLFHILNSYNNIDSFILCLQYLQDSIYHEIKIKKLHNLSITIILDDILHTLYSMSTFDLKPQNNSTCKRLEKFEKNFLQYEVRKELTADTWSIMTLYIFIWTTALQDYLYGKHYSKLKLVDKISKEYDYYVSLNKKAQIIFMNGLKKDIIEKNNNFYLDNIEDPLRILYLYYVLSIL